MQTGGNYLWMQLEWLNSYLFTSSTAATAMWAFIREGDTNAPSLVMHHHWWAPQSKLGGMEVLLETVAAV